MALQLEKNPAIPELRALLALTMNERESANIVTFRNQGGEVATTLGLKKTPEVAVAEAVVPDGMVFDEHTHDAEVEWIVVYRGTLLYRDMEGERILRVGQGVSVPKGRPHHVEAVGGDAHVIAITIPASEVFPDGP